MTTQLPEVAFYYPNPMWRESAWIKNLLLFFDGIALLVPQYMLDKPREIDPLAGELADQGLLHLIQPETFLDVAATNSLATTITEILASGALDSLARKRTRFHELSYSRLGYMADPRLAEMILEQLKRRGLAEDSKDGVSIPMHPHVRSLILVLLAQILRPNGRQQGLDLSPATDRPEIIAALRELLNLPSMPSAGHVVSLDVQAVGVDLTNVPTHEVLGFRKEHLTLYRRYAKTVRAFLEAGVPSSAGEQRKALRLRRLEIKDEAEALRKLAKDAWKKPIMVGLGLTGAVWKALHGDWLTALVAVGATGLGAKSTTVPVGASAYSYLFQAKEELTGSALRRFMSGLRLK